MLGSAEGRRAALAWATPTPWGAVVLLMVGSFVRSVIEQFAQAHAVERDPRRLREAAERLLKGR